MYTGDLKRITEPEHLLWLLSETDFYVESKILKEYCRNQLLKEDSETLAELYQFACQMPHMQEIAKEISVKIAL